jgi:hypothetical protein
MASLRLIQLVLHVNLNIFGQRILNKNIKNNSYNKS